jgi:high-affinity iron transporter
MIASFLITFRETLEAALIIGVVWGYLARTNNRQYLSVIVKGTVAGILASILGAIAFQVVAGGFHGRTEELFEGFTMLIGGSLLTSMILWMMTRNIDREIEGKLAAAVGSANKTTLFLLIFFSIWREGIETVLFLSGAGMMDIEYGLTGGILGIAMALFTGWVFFEGSMKLNLKTVFNVSNVLLVLFAAGLFAHGVHELQEAGALPIFIEHVWDINPAIAANGNYPLLHEKGAVGGIFKGVFGYNGNPSLIEIITYLIYIMATAALWININKKKTEQIMIASS